MDGGIIRLIHRPKALFVAACFVACLAWTAPLAHADPDLAAYVEMLDIGGVPYDTPAGAVLMGQGVCTALADDRGIDAVEHGLMVGGRSAGEADWTKDQADWLITAAVADLCPQERAVLKAYGPPFFK
ncbi:DUF732 domain-containing protein [Mycobacterium asiaticum]|uniref:DUF732 domain-containing protein n=1 Tax=Mycobacterium asiaticum TaxID=1790 RepID=A0A1A3N5V1_MYCAS|nr:DUF732 domain-containing protein [Mycobacterium asiaticum]OBK15747.1 hypothetical protein A5636_05240 [Mycobacterium asiaticum]